MFFNSSQPANAADVAENQIQLEVYAFEQEEHKNTLLRQYSELDKEIAESIINGLYIKVEKLEDVSSSQLEKALQYLLLTSSEASRHLLSPKKITSSNIDPSVFEIYYDDQIVTALANDCGACASASCTAIDVSCKSSSFCFFAGCIFGDSCIDGSGNGCINCEDDDAVPCCAAAICCGTLFTIATSIITPSIALDIGISHSQENAAIKALKIGGTYLLAAGAALAYTFKAGTQVALSISGGEDASWQYQLARIGIPCLIACGTKFVTTAITSCIQCTPKQTNPPPILSEAEHQKGLARLYKKMGTALQQDKTTQNVVAQLSTIKKFLAKDFQSLYTKKPAEQFQLAVHLAQDVIKISMLRMRDPAPDSAPAIANTPINLTIL